MAFSCDTARCGTCGRKKRPNDDIISTRDSESMDRELLDVSWSPLGHSRERYITHQGRSYSPCPGVRTVLLNAVSDTHVSDDLLANKREAENLKRQKVRHRTMNGREQRRLSRFMLDFARGMAAAFGAATICTPETLARNAYSDHSELGDWRPSTSILPGVLPSRTRIRIFFSRMKPKPVSLSPEQIPLVAQHSEHKQTASYHQVAAAFPIF